MTSRVFKAVLLGVAIGATGIAASVLPPVIDLEEGLGLSVLFRLRGVSKPPPDVVIVSVDRRSSDALGLPDALRKWPRSLHARLTDALVRQGASVIAFDMYFEEPRDPKDDRAMAEAFAKAGNVVVCRRLHAEWVSRPRQGGGGPDELRVLSEISSMPSVAGSAVLAPFPLPKVPLKVSKTGTFVSTAGDETPTLPVAGVDGSLSPRPALDFAVNLDPKESDFAKVRAQHAEDGSVSSTTPGDAPTRRIELWHAVAAALLAFLVVEGLITRRG